MSITLEMCSWPAEASLNRSSPATKPMQRYRSAYVPSLLDRLPREVRDHIYSYILPDRGSTISIGGHNSLRLERSIKKLRRIDGSGRRTIEALQTYWRTRTFVFCRRLDFCFTWRSLVKRMATYGIDVHKELRKVEICAWSRLDSRLVQRTKPKWELTKDAFKMAMRILHHCTALNKVNICFDVGHLWIEEIRPLMKVDCGQLTIEVAAGDAVERWTGERSRAILEGRVVIEQQFGGDALGLHVAQALSPATNLVEQT